MAQARYLGRAGLILSIIGLVLHIVAVLFPGMGWDEIPVQFIPGLVGLVLGIVGAVMDEKKTAGIVAIVFGSINLALFIRFIACIVLYPACKVL
jgi:hypothetical protein